MLHRNITAALLVTLGDTPVVALSGARQTGKSTLARALVESAHPATYLTRDDADVLDAAAPESVDCAGQQPPPRHAGAQQKGPVRS